MNIKTIIEILEKNNEHYVSFYNEKTKIVTHIEYVEWDTCGERSYIRTWWFNDDGTVAYTESRHTAMGELSLLTIYGCAMEEYSSPEKWYDDKTREHPEWH